MKKRKPPVVLASLLIVMIGAAVIINLPKNESKPGEPPQKTAEESLPAGQSRPTPSKESIKTKLQQATVGGPDEDSMEPPGREGMMGRAKTATIFLPKASAQKQAPNDASVSGQWYRGNARANDPEGFKNPTP